MQQEAVNSLTALKQCSKVTYGNEHILIVFCLFVCFGKTRGRDKIINADSGLRKDTYHSWWINLILPVQTHGWYKGLSGVPSERHTRQISAAFTNKFVLSHHHHHHHHFRRKCAQREELWKQAFTRKNFKIIDLWKHK